MGATSGTSRELLATLLTALLTSAAGCGHATHVEATDGPTPRESPLRALGAPSQDVAAAWAATDARCDGCHPVHAAEHAASAHGRAFTHPVFRAEYARTPSPACARCHAPLSVPEAPAAGVERGVACLTCHTLGAPGNGEHPASCLVAVGAPPRARCGTCHEFPTEWLETPGEYAPGQLLQRTVTEHAASVARAVGSGCVTCHAPQVASGPDGASARTVHTWPGARDAATLRSAFEVEAVTVRDASAVRVTLTLRSRAGHAVPTGDVYRALVVEVADATRPMEADGTPRSSLVQLERQFEETPLGLQEVGDTRLPADGTPRVLALTLPPDVERVRVVVEWQALRPSVASARGLADDDVRRVALDVELGVPATAAW